MTTTILVAASLALILAAAGGLLTDVGPWYRALRKPSLQPPDWLFGPAWTVILGLAAASGAIAWHRTHGLGVSVPNAGLRIGILFGVNFVCHLTWSPLFFKLKRPDWSLIEVGFLWCSCLALVIGLAPLSHLASWLVVPYLAWVSFATWLNYAVVSLNKPFGRPRMAAALQTRS